MGTLGANLGATRGTAGTGARQITANRPRLAAILGSRATDAPELTRSALEHDSGQAAIGVVRTGRRSGTAALAFAAIGCCLVLPARAHASAYAPYQCSDGAAPNFAPLICNFSSKKAAVQNCIHVTTAGRPYELDKSGFVGGSHTIYNEHFLEVPVGCRQLGSNTVTYDIVLRKGPSGPFVRISSVATVPSSVNVNVVKVGTQPITINRRVALSIQCTPDLAGSVVATEVVSTFVPRKGWGITKSTTRKAYSRPAPVCG